MGISVLGSVWQKGRIPLHCIAAGFSTTLCHNVIVVQNQMQELLKATELSNATVPSKRFLPTKL